jgi:carboxymethylenebutenolidase
MCDEHTFHDNEEAFASGRITRRGLGVFASAASVAMLLPHAANAADVKGADVSIKTPDGDADEREASWRHRVAGHLRSSARV